MAACTRRAESEHGYCPTHYVALARRRHRRSRHRAAALGPDQPAVAEGGLVSLRGLAPLVAVQVLFGLQQRTRGGAKTTDVDLRGVCDALRRQQVAHRGCAPARSAGKAARSLLRALARHARLALADPASEQDKDIWDLAVFGHPGRLSFTGITQPWLRQAAKAWAAEELPRHRGGGAAKVREKISALARLSDSLRARPDHGDVPAALGRGDIDSFLNRLGYLESAGTISRYRRNVDLPGCPCRPGRDPRSRPDPARPAGGRAARRLHHRGRATSPPTPARGEPGRDLPPEIMAKLCASLDGLQPAEVRAPSRSPSTPGGGPRTSSALPLDCLARDRTARPCWSTTTPRPTGWAAACRSARPPPR